MPRTPAAAPPRSPRRSALRIALFYAAFGTVWLLASDSVLFALISDTGTMSVIQTLKGWVFVWATAILIYALVSRQLTREHRVQAALEESEATYRLLVQNQTDFVVKLEPGGRHRFVNLAYCDLFATTADGLFGKPFADRILEEDRDEVRRALTALSRFPHSCTIELRALTASGQRWLGWALKGVLGQEGALEAVVGLGRDVTERRRAEEDLRAARDHLMALYDASPDMIFLHGPDGRLVDANEHALMALGATHEEILAAPPGHYVGYGSSGEDAVARVRRAQAGEAVDFESTGRDKNGRKFPVEVRLRRVAPAGRGDGAQAGVLAVVRDISRAKRSEAELSRHVRLLEVLQEIDQAILRASRKLQVTRVILARIRRLVPCEHASVVLLDPAGGGGGRVFAVDEGVSLGPPEGRQLEGDELWAIPPLSDARGVYVDDVDQAANLSLRTRELSRNGLRSFATLPLGLEGRLTGYLNLGFTSTAPLTEEDRTACAEVATHLTLALQQLGLMESLENERHRLRSLIDQIPDGIALLDENGRVTLANPLARAHLSKLVEIGKAGAIGTLGGRPLGDLLKSGSERTEIALPGHRPETFEVILRPTYSFRGPPGYLLVVRDLTRERELQQHVEQQQRLAAVGQLAAGIGHDFNNILQAILSTAELLERSKELPPQVIDRLRNVIAQSERGARLVQQLLDFSRNSVSRRSPLDLGPLVKEITRFLQRVVPEDVTFSVTVDSGAHMVVADPTQIQQLLMNLAVNARDAMPEGGEFRLHLSESPPEKQPSRFPPGRSGGRWVCLEVEDTGHGIPAGLQGRVFEPFFTTKEVGKGTGLGLAQVYGIVRQHDGLIDFTSEPGKGTRFRIYLPRHQEAGAGVTARSPAPSGRGELVLVVEDDPSLLKLTAASLETLGYRTLCAADGPGALDLYSRHWGLVSLVLTDAVMPGMDGRELGRRLREMDPDARILLMTGYPIPKQEGRPEREGWVQKPYTLDRLARAVCEALSPLPPPHL